MTAPTVEPAVRWEVEEFLVHEAELLDDNRFEEWLGLLHKDIHYVVPVRLTQERGGRADVADKSAHMDERLQSLKLRVARLRTGYAWAEDPASRTRHFVTNIRVSRGDEPKTFHVRSNLLLYRNRGSDASHDLISAERHDVLIQTDRGWRIRDRRVLLDQATLGTKNLGIFF